MEFSLSRYLPCSCSQCEKRDARARRERGRREELRHRHSARARARESARMHGREREQERASARGREREAHTVRQAEMMGWTEGGQGRRGDLTERRTVIFSKSPSDISFIPNVRRPAFISSKSTKPESSMSNLSASVRPALSSADRSSSFLTELMSPPPPLLLLLLLLLLSSLSFSSSSSSQGAESGWEHIAKGVYAHSTSTFSNYRRGCGCGSVGRRWT